MNHTAHAHRFSSPRSSLSARDAIEWEELPSLATSLAQRLIVRGRPGSDFQNSSSFATAWDATMPAPLEPAVEPEPFRETLHGLITRELREPEVFRHFFLAGGAL